MTLNDPIADLLTRIRPGRVMFEVGGVPKDLAQNALRRAAAKLGIKTRFVERIERV